MLDGETVARFGQLHPEVAAARKLRQDVFLAEVMLDRLYKHPLREPKYRRFSKFPAVGRDFSFALRRSSNCSSASIPPSKRWASLRCSRSLRAKIYRGDKVGAGKYSTLLHAEFQSQERTLRDDEVAQWSAQIVKALEALGGMLRT